MVTVCIVFSLSKQSHRKEGTLITEETQGNTHKTRSGSWGLCVVETGKQPLHVTWGVGQGVRV